MSLISKLLVWKNKIKIGRVAWRVTRRNSDWTLSPEMTYLNPQTPGETRRGGNSSCGPDIAQQQLRHVCLVLCGRSTAELYLALAYTAQQVIGPSMTICICHTCFFRFVRNWKVFRNSQKCKMSAMKPNILLCFVCTEVDMWPAHSFTGTVRQQTVLRRETCHQLWPTDGAALCLNSFFESLFKNYVASHGLRCSISESRVIKCEYILTVVTGRFMFAPALLIREW
jgi:hypothetical protein